MHVRCRPAFTIVTPADSQVFVADAKAADNILHRNNDFGKKAVANAPFNIFGWNVSSADGEMWQRHRRLTVPPFSERNSGLVWSESSRQAQEMPQVWLDKGDADTNTTAEGTNLLALHVLTGVGLDLSYAFDSALVTPGAGHKVS